MNLRRSTLPSRLLGSTILTTLVVARPAAAHHAFVAQYDSTRPVAVTGVVVKIEWLNPHAYFFLDVKDETTGEVVTWAAEMGSPVSLVRRGWSRNSMKIGDVVAVEGIRARDGSALLNAQSIVLTETGKRLFTRSAAEERSAESDASNQDAR